MSSQLAPAAKKAKIKHALFKTKRGVVVTTAKRKRKKKRKWKKVKPTRKRRRGSNNASASESSESGSESDANEETSTEEIPKANNLVISPAHSSEIYFNADITPVTALRFVLLLNRKARKHMIQSMCLGLNDSPPIKVIITSDGGCLDSTFVMVDAISKCPVTVNTHVPSSASSGATIMSTSATGRATMAPRAVMLLHQLRGGSMGTFSEMSDEQHNSEVAMHTIREHYLSMCHGLGKKQLAKILQNERVLTSKECLRLGVVDEVM